MRENKILIAAENLSTILHELEEKGIELTEEQERQWSKATEMIQEARGVK